MPRRPIQERSATCGKMSSANRMGRMVLTSA
jgi:hypothetical protein